MAQRLCGFSSPRCLFWERQRHKTNTPSTMEPGQTRAGKWRTVLYNVCLSRRGGKVEQSRMKYGGKTRGTGVGIWSLSKQAVALGLTAFEEDGAISVWPMTRDKRTKKDSSELDNQSFHQDILCPSKGASSTQQCTIPLRVFQADKSHSSPTQTQHKPRRRSLLNY